MTTKNIYIYMTNSHSVRLLLLLLYEQVLMKKDYDDHGEERKEAEEFAISIKAGSLPCSS